MQKFSIDVFLFLYKSAQALQQTENGLIIMHDLSTVNNINLKTLAFLMLSGWPKMANVCTLFSLFWTVKSLKIGQYLTMLWGVQKCAKFLGHPVHDFMYAYICTKSASHNGKQVRRVSNNRITKTCWLNFNKTSRLSM